MTPTTLVQRAFVALAFFAGSIAAAAAAETSPVVKSIDSETFSVTCSATNVFARSPKKLQARAREIATRFCTEKGKQLKVMEEKVDKPMLPPDFVSVTLVFKAVDAPEPELAPTPVARRSSPVPATPTDVLYAEITKLDELRRKGLLTDAEFESEKQKVLNRSR